MSPSSPTLPFLLSLTLLTAGCGARAAGPTTVPRAASTSTVGQLRSEIDALLDRPTVNALWAVKVQSLDSGRVLYERNAHLLIMPASNMKILTMAVAADRLGWDARFTTRVEATGPIEGGVLRGDLVVVGSGDPTIGVREGTTRVLDAWAQRLKALGISRIDGRIIGDDDAFEDEMLGEGWAWDDLAFSYAAPGGALVFNENVVSLVIRPAAEAGSPATATLEPDTSDLRLDADVTTTAAGTQPDVQVMRRLRDRRLIVRGTVPQAGRDYTRLVSVDTPTRYFAAALRSALTAAGIEVAGAAVDIDEAEPKPAPEGRQLLFAHESPPLSEIGARFMKVSQNLIGETLMTRIGLAAGATPADAIETARETYVEVLGRFGVPESELIVSDGSGLSRYNYVTANAIVTVLRRLALDPAHVSAFEATLPVMGREGTLSNRMRGTRAEGTVRAKTGSLASVRALSGYLTNAAGERLVFSIIANNFKARSTVIDAIADGVVETLIASELK